MTTTRCEWCKQDGCRNHEAVRSFPLGSPAIVGVGPAPDRNATYALSREALIPEAERLADLAAGPKPRDPWSRRAWGDAWSRAFHAAMERLWQARGKNLGPCSPIQATGSR